MHWKRAGAALIAATAITLTTGTPSDAQHTAAPKAKATAIDYGSGPWGGPIGTAAQTGDPATASVFLYGDSIGARCTPDIRTALAAKGHTLYTYTWPSQNTQGLVNAMMSAPRLGPEVIMQAGTNDVFNPFAATAQVARGADYLTETGSDWHWMDSYVGRPAYLVDDVRNSGQVSAQIHGVVGEAKVVRWVDALTAARGRGRALSYYLQDGVHPWAAAGTGHADGCAFLAAVVSAAIPDAPR